MQQVREAIDLAREFTSRSLLVHCFHGVGRSAGIALGVLAGRLGAGKEASVLDQLLAVGPEVTPNLVVVKLADHLLARSGDLIKAVAIWEATAPGLKERAMRE